MKMNNPTLRIQCGRRAAAATATTTIRPSLSLSLFPSTPFLLPPPSRRSSSSSSSSSSPIPSHPTWSVRKAFLSPPSPSPSPSSPTPSIISPSALYIYHQLSGLSPPPPPSTSTSTSTPTPTTTTSSSISDDLTRQLSFVGAVRGVDTRGVEPLRAIRDETARGRREDQTLGVAQLAAALAAEEVVGHARRPRRARAVVAVAAAAVEGEGEGEDQGGEKGPRRRQRRRRNEEEDWDVLGGAAETAGAGYFVVRAGGVGGAGKN
ncbi:hypothetical protein F5X96DRAFT_562710 [Biscogniauxia mediterranea]|nr:hypothetical protein F5X96DRAFT_562710 [Biscogniauxia mediterranea]